MLKKKSILIIILLIIILFIFFVLFKKDKNTNVVNNNELSENQLSENINKILSTNNNSNDKDNNMETNKKEINLIILKTNMGDISFELLKDKPLTTSNFIKLAEEGFYDNVRFHRVINGFMIQTGDPNSKDINKKSIWGMGDPGYKFNDELTGKETYNIGTVAMANSGPNTNGSQFFIMTSNTPLPPNYTVFGKVISGQDVANKIQLVETDANDRPIKDIIINSVELK